MRWVLRVFSRNEYHDGGCALASVDLTPQLAELELRRIDNLRTLQAHDHDAQKVYYWNSEAAFFNPFVRPGDASGDAGSGAGEELLDRIEKAVRDFIEADEAFEIAENQIAAVECSQTVVWKEGVAYTAIPKHGSFYVETAEIPAEALLRAAQLS